MKPALTLDSRPAVVDAAYHFGQLNFREVRYADNYWMPLHAHKEGCLVFVLKGTIKGAWEKQGFVATPSALAYFPADSLHTSLFQDNVETFDIVFRPQWMERIREYAAFVNAPGIHQSGLPTWLARRLYHEFQSRDSLTPLVMEGLTLELLGHLSRNTAAGVDSHIPRWLRQARDFLHAHCTESLSLDTIATAVGVHPAHLTRSFRQHYHCTLGSYARRLRVEYACLLLSTSDKPLCQIACDAGFADQSHFSRTFKSLMGMTPAQYKNSAGPAGLKQEMLP